MIKSLVWKNEKPSGIIERQLYGVITEDLRLDIILSLMSHEPQIVITPEIFLGFVTNNRSDILFRQCILKDLMGKTDNLSKLHGIISDVSEMETLHKEMCPDLQVPIMMLRYKKLEIFLKIMNSLEELFSINRQSGSSEEYMEIAQSIKDFNKRNQLDELKEDLKKISAIILDTKSLEIGANIDDSGIREAVVMEVNDFRYKKTDFMDKIKCSRGSDFKAHSIAPGLDITNLGFLQIFRNEIYEDFENLIESDLILINRILEKYKDIVTSSVLQYRNEFCLYYGAIRLSNFIESRGFESAFPEISESFDFEGIYSLHMLYESSIESGGSYKPVKNSVAHKDDKTIILVTGPNNGGKTIFVQTLGVSQLLFQNGLIAPVKKGSMRIYNKIYTHFPKEEDINLGAGRLGEEAARVSGIYSKVTEDSLVVLNEPYITTSPVEGLDILIKSLKKLKNKGAVVYLVTHYLDIMKKCDDISGFASYVMEIKGDMRTYKALRRLPLEKSYAMEMAEKLMVDADGLLTDFQKEVR